MMDIALLVGVDKGRRAGMKCRDCKWCYSNETMGSLYICVNGESENFAEFTGLCCEDDCEDGEMDGKKVE